MQEALKVKKRMAKKRHLIAIARRSFKVRRANRKRSEEMESKREETKTPVAFSFF